MSIKGWNEVKSRLANEIENMKKKSMKGIIQAEILIRRDMDKTPPKIPVDTGNLRASWFTTNFQRETGPLGILGFNANYALKVHEDMKTKFKRPGSGPKFLEACLNRNHSQILQLIAGETKIPK